MIRAVKGTRDILPPTSGVWNHVEETARKVFHKYNYHEIRTPILEETALFARGVGEETDIVSKEMYTFIDRDETSLTLRPEATASVMRAYIEHRLDQQPGLKKLYYIGPMFRRERPQKGRFRQFYQIGAEAIGSESPLVDVEVIEMVTEILNRLEIRGFQLIINSVGCSKCRPVFMEKLKDALRDIAPRLCQDCQRRVVTNPLRVLDCKVPEDQPLIEGLPSILDALDEECRAHFETVKACLGDLGIAFEVRPRLVRGLDYYMRTTFEIVHGSLGAQNSVLGGGRYDGLAESIGSKVAAPGIGFSIGEDRLVMTVQETHPKSPKDQLDVFIVALGKHAARECASLAQEVRNADFSVELSTDAKAKRAFEVANKLGARVAVILGDDEMKSGHVSLKNMTSGVQLSTGRAKFLEILRKELENA